MYFTHTNIFYPVLHRPTFEANLSERLHLRDEKFGAVVLLVCVIGSKFSNDSRVKRRGPNSPEWFWFHQVDFLRGPLYYPMTLYDVQIVAVSMVARFYDEFSSFSAVRHGIRMDCAAAKLLVINRDRATGCPRRGNSPTQKRPNATHCGKRTLESGLLVSFSLQLLLTSLF